MTQNELRDFIISKTPTLDFQSDDGCEYHVNFQGATSSYANFGTHYSISFDTLSRYGVFLSDDVVLLANGWKAYLYSNEVKD